MNVERLHSPAAGPPRRRPPSPDGDRARDTSFAARLECAKEHADARRGGPPSAEALAGLSELEFSLRQRLSSTASPAVVDGSCVQCVEGQALSTEPAGGSVALPGKAKGDCSELVDPLEFTLAVPTASVASPLPNATLPASAVPPPVWPMIERLVRRLAVGGDGRSGTARIEIGAGELSGATLLVTTLDGVVDVALELPPGVGPGDWEPRLRERFERSSIRVGSIAVR